MELNCGVVNPGPYSVLSQQKRFLHALKRKNLGAKADFRHPLPLNYSKCYSQTIDCLQNRP